MDIRSGVWRHSPSVGWLPMGSGTPAEGVVIVESHGADSAPRVLQGTASAIWNALDGRKPFDAVVDELCAEYELSRFQVGAELEVFLTTLVESRLIESVSHEAAH